MRSHVPSYELRAPEHLGDALDLVDRGWKPFAGGTDLMVLFEAGGLEDREFVGLWRLAELKGISTAGGWVDIGALTTYTDVRQSELLRRDFPLLGQAAAETGGIATQNRGTLGGNIANGSPAADSCPVLLVYDAELTLVSRRGARRVPYTTFHTGYKRMNLEPGEIIRTIHLPRDKSGWSQVFRKVGTRKAQAISKVCLAATARIEDRVIQHIRVAYGSVAPVPLRCVRTEQALRGASLDALPELPDEITPIDDIRSTAKYRARVAGNLLRRFLGS